MKFQDKTYKRCRRILLTPLATLLCLSLISMGGLFWVDNSRALIRDADPTTRIEMGLLLGGSFDLGAQAKLKVDGGVIPIAGGFLVKGNGDQDDNKEEAFIFRSLSGRIIKPQAFLKAVSSFRERRTVAAYKDFGHLKVMPAADFIIVKHIDLFINQRLSVYRGRPLLV